MFYLMETPPCDTADCSDRGILVPGGFGQRGTEGMMLAIKWAREQKIPFLGICLGFQLAVIEWARNVCGLAGTSPDLTLVLSRSRWGCGTLFLRDLSSLRTLCIIICGCVLTLFGITV
jgi:hypothetical protein